MQLFTGIKVNYLYISISILKWIVPVPQMLNQS